MSFVENLKKRSLDRKIFLIGCVVAFIGFFIPFISFNREATLNQVLNKITKTEKVKFNETYTEEIPSADGTKATVEKTRRAFRTITETKVALPTKSFAKVDVEFKSGLTDSLKKDFDSSLDFEKLPTAAISVVNTDPASAIEPTEPKKPADGADAKTMAKYREELAQYAKDKDSYDEKKAQRENFIMDLEKECKEISTAEGKAKDAMKSDKSMIDYQEFTDPRASTKVSVKYTIKNIFAAATFFNFAEPPKYGFAYNSTFLVALWLCTIAGIIVFMVSNSIILDTFVWLIGTGFGLASVIKLHEFILYLTDVDVGVFGYTSIGGYIICIGWTTALVGVILSAAHVKQQGIRKEI